MAAFFTVEVDQQGAAVGTIQRADRVADIGHFLIIVGSASGWFELGYNRSRSRLSVSLASRLLFLSAAVLATLSAQSERVVVDNLPDLQKCVSQPAGPPLVCALSASGSPYGISGSPLSVRRSD